MYELIQVGKRTYYIDCPTKIGLYLINDEEVCLIDSGNDKDVGKKVLKILEANNWTLKMIINTHSHADHIGGNQVLQQRTGCKIYATKSESGFIERPLLEPMFLSGAYPPKELRSKWFMAKESVCEELTEKVLPKGLSIIPLEGHSVGQIGIRTSDDVVFLADCLVGGYVLEKYRIFYTVDVEKHLETLERVKGLTANLFVPSHAEATTDIGELAETNIKATKDMMADIAGICGEPLTMEEIIKGLFDQYHLDVDFGQYHLNGTTVKAIVAYLHDQGQLDMICKENRVLWKWISN